MKKSSAILPLCAGLAVGSGAVWIAEQFGTAAAVATDSVREARGSAVASPDSAALVFPPPLSGTEADAALAAYLALPPLAKDAPSAERHERMERLHVLLALLPATHLEKLLVALAIRDGDAEGNLTRAVFDVWTEIDASAAARWALTIAPDLRAHYVAQATLAWAREDFSSAWNWTTAIADRDIRNSLAPELLAQLAAIDPLHALSLGAALGPDMAGTAQISIFQAWAKRDPSAALRHLGPALIANRDALRPVRRALVDWILREPDAAIDWAVAQPAPDGEAHRSPFGQLGWSIPNTPEAFRAVADALARRSDIPGGDYALQSLLGAWQYQNPDAVLAWLDTLADVGRRSDLITHILGYTTGGAPDRYLALVRRLPDTPEKGEQITRHITDWAQKHPGAAQDWLARHPEPDLAAARRLMEGVLIAHLAHSEPQGAINRLAALPDNHASLREITTQLARNWAQSDPSAATQWFWEQAHSPRLPHARHDLSLIARSWVLSDAVAYADWVQTLPAGENREQAENALADVRLAYENVSEISDPPPRAAYADRLAKIKDPSLRSTALHAHVHRWMQSDFHAARNWLESSDALSPEAAARLISENSRHAR